MTTHTDLARASVRSLFRLLERIEAEPHRAEEISRLRHLSAVVLDFHGEGPTPIPIESTVLLADLRPPHPLANGGVNDGRLVGDFTLYEHYRTHHTTAAGYAGWRVLADGSVEYVTPEGTAVPHAEAVGDE